MPYATIPHCRRIVFRIFTPETQASNPATVTNTYQPQHTSSLFHSHRYNHNSFQLQHSRMYRMISGNQILTQPNSMKVNNSLCRFILHGLFYFLSHHAHFFTHFTMPQNEQSTPQQSTPCHFITPTMQHHHALVIQESKSLLIRFSTGSTISEAALVLAQCAFSTRSV